MRTFWRVSLPLLRPAIGAGGLLVALYTLRDFGAVVCEIDGHDLNAMRQASAEPHEGRPLIILAHTSPTQGMGFLRQRFPRLHYVRFKTEEERAAMNREIAAELGIDPIAYSH